MEINPYSPPESNVVASPDLLPEFIYAGFWRRFAALIIDGIVFGVLDEVLTLVIGESIPALILAAALQIGIIVYCWMTYGATPGKKAMGIMVVSTDGRPLSLGQCLIRYFSYILSALGLLLGYFWMIWDPRNQTWHDKLGNSLVVQA